MTAPAVTGQIIAQPSSLPGSGIAAGRPALAPFPHLPGSYGASRQMTTISAILPRGIASAQSNLICAKNPATGLDSCTAPDRRLRCVRHTGLLCRSLPAGLLGVTALDAL